MTSATCDVTDNLSLESDWRGVGRACAWRGVFLPPPSSRPLRERCRLLICTHATSTAREMMASDWQLSRHFPRTPVTSRHVIGTLLLLMSSLIAIF